MAKHCAMRTSSWSAPWTAAVAGWAPCRSRKAATKFPARRMLGKVSLANKTALADALHTQLETAQQILFEGGGDYALTVKDNQKELVRTLATLLTPGKFSPSTHDADPRADSRTQSQSARDSGSGMPGSHPRAGE